MAMWSADNTDFSVHEGIKQVCLWKCYDQYQFFSVFLFFFSSVDKDDIDNNYDDNGDMNCITIL